jgi:3-isopropylmalate dehydratase small subunit
MNMGKAFVYGDHVDTDVIIPARYLNASDPAWLAAHCMEDIDGCFAQQVEPGDVIVAGRNFGCGSSREHAPAAIKASGVQCVIARSFARIFYRNAFNIGLPILECPEAADGISSGDRIRIDFAAGLIVNETKGEEYRAKPFPPFMSRIVESGGLAGYVRSVLEQEGETENGV